MLDFVLLWLAGWMTNGSFPVENVVDCAILYSFSYSSSLDCSISLPRDINLLCKEDLLYVCRSSFILAITS